MKYPIWIITLLVVFSGTAFAFDDVAEADMQYVWPLVEKGIIRGKDDGLFHGEDSLTRAEAVALLVRSMDLEGMAALAPSPFTDMDGHWAEPCVDLYWSLGLVDGKPGNVFDPDAPLTYAQWVKLLLDLEGYENEADELGGFPQGYMELANERAWRDDGTGRIDRLRVAEMLSGHVSRPFSFKRVMTVRQSNEISFSEFDSRWAFARWQICDDSGSMLAAEKTALDPQGKSIETIQKAVTGSLRLDRLGTGRYSVNLEMLGEGGKVVCGGRSRLIVLPRDLAVPEDIPVLKMDVLRLSQGYGGEGGHKGTYAIDMIGKDDGSDALCAPFDGIIRKIYSENGSQNFVWLESEEPQTLPNGEVGHVTVMTGHDNHIETLYVGKRIRKGEAYYHEGNSGAARGNHIHLEAGFSKATKEGWALNEYGRWGISNGIAPEDVFVLDDSATWIETPVSGAIEFKYLE